MRQAGQSREQRVSHLAALVAREQLASHPCLASNLGLAPALPSPKLADVPGELLVRLHEREPTSDRRRWHAAPMSDAALVVLGGVVGALATGGIQWLDALRQRRVTRRVAARLILGDMYVLDGAI